MARARPQRTKHPGVYRRETTHGTVYDVCVRSNGRQHWERGKYRRLDDAYQRRLHLLYQANHGTLPHKPVTLSAFVEETWFPHQLARIRQGTLKQSTYDQYRRDMRGIVLPAVGTVRIDRIDFEVLESFRDMLVSYGYANYSVRRIITPLSSALELARKRRRIPANPAHGLELPEARAARAPVILTIGELYDLASSAPTDDDRRLILVTAFTGLRQGEAFSLRWGSVYLAAGEEHLVIEDRVYEGRVAPTKTSAGRRYVPIEAGCAALLREQASHGRDSAERIVFPSPRGCYWHSSNFDRRVWIATREKAGIPEVVFSDLRDFYVTAVRHNSGLPSSVTERYVGHAGEQIHGLYTHRTPETDAQFRERLGPLFAPPDND